MARHTGGWVKLWRKAVLGDIGSNYTRGGLFGALVAMANIQQSTVSWRGKPRKLERGQIATSLKELADLGEVERKTVWKHLQYLQNRNTISIETSNFGTLITILNYEKYRGQDADLFDVQEHDMDDGMDNTMDNTMDDGVPHIEEEKNKRRKEIYARFDELAKSYRDKFKGTTTGPAKDRFQKQIKTDEDLAELIAAMDHYRRFLDDNDWRRPKQTFATFLGTKTTGFFWRDFITMPESSGPGGSIDWSKFTHDEESA